jgi:hypothetical protein
MKHFRKPRPDIGVLCMPTYTVFLDNGQAFYETARAYELWQEKPLMRIKRFPKSRVFATVRNGQVNPQ